MMYVNVPALFDQFYPMLSMMGPMIAAQLGRQGIEFDPAILPPAEKIKKHLLPDVAVVRRTSSGITFTERTALPGISAGRRVPEWPSVCCCRRSRRPARPPAAYSCRTT